MRPTPELDKRREALEPRPVNDVLSKFVDWLTSEGIVLARWGPAKERQVRCPRCRGKGFDPEALSPREAQLLDRGLLKDADRAACPMCDDRSGYVRESYVDEGSLAPIHESWERLFARHLGIDLAKVDQEQRQLLEDIRAAA